jgi:hypothetical protein
MATWADVRELALALPATRETTSYGNVAWAVGDKTFVWERPLTGKDVEALGDAAPDGPILGVRTAGLEMKEMLLAGAPKVFFTTPHFDGYPAVLVRLEEAWLARAPKRAREAFLRDRA